MPALKKTSILPDASPKRPPGFPSGPNTAEAAQRSRVVTGQQLPTGLAPTQTCLQIHQREWEGPVQTQAPSDSMFSGSCCAPLCCYLAPFLHSATTFLWGNKTGRQAVRRLDSRAEGRRGGGAEGQRGGPAGAPFLLHCWRTLSG